MLFTASVSVCAEFVNVFIDKVVAAQFLGDTALAAISFFTPLFSFIFFMSAVVMVGSLVCYSIELGRMNKEKADRFFGQSLILSFIVGVFMVVLFSAGKGIMFGVMDVEPELLNYVNEFYGWFLGLAFIIPLNNTLQEMVYVDGDTGTCKASYAALLLGNLVLSCIFCRFMGMSGIALGTLLSVMLSIIVLCTHFARKNNSLRFVWHFNMRDSMSVIRFSIAEACEFFFFALFAGLMNLYFVANFSSDRITVLSVVYEIVELSVVFNGIWMAAEPLINIYRGEDNDRGVLQVMRFVNWTVLKESLLATAILLFCAPLLTHVFHIRSEELAGEMAFAIRACAVGLCPLALVKIYAAFHVHEKPVLSFIFILFVMFLSPVVCVMGAGALWGGEYVWLGFGAAPFLAMGLCAGVQVLIYGRARFPLLLEHLTVADYWHMHDMLLTPENLIAYRDSVGELLKRKSVNEMSVVKAMLLLEEMGMSVYERNAGRRVFVEFAVLLREKDFVLVIKDDGKIMDLTDLEQSVTGLRAYLVNMFMTVQREKQYLLTSNYNRHVFRFDR